VRKEKTTDTEDAAASAAVNLASTASADADNTPAGGKTLIVIIRPPIRRLSVTTTAEVMPSSLRLPR
jgi:hypothetical protein